MRNKDKNMDVSIIIVNYKTPELVVECIRSIREKTTGISYEIIIVDNDSKDNSLEIFSTELEEDIKVVVANENLGFGKANNLGAQHATGKYLFLLNSDTLLINNAIQILYQYIEKNNHIGVVGGDLFTSDMKASPSFAMQFDDLDSVKQAARWSNIIKNIVRRVIRERIYISKRYKEKIRYKDIFNYENVPKKVAYIFGADMLVRSDIFRQLKGFDPEFFMYAEEEELSWRITNNNFEIWNIPEAQIIHYDGATIKKSEEFSERQYKMRLTGIFTYYKKRFGKKGIKDFYYYKKLELSRIYQIGKILNRKKLMELVAIQKKCVEDVYKKFEK